LLILLCYILLDELKTIDPQRRKPITGSKNMVFVSSLSTANFQEMYIAAIWLFDLLIVIEV